MWAEIGIFALVASFFCSLLLVMIPGAGVIYSNTNWMKTAGYYVFWQWLFGILAFICLDFSFLTNDFSVVYVRMNSSIMLPWFYKACAVWGGHEGSMLLWICTLQTWTLAVAAWSQSLTLVMRTRVLVILAMLSVGFLLFILLTSNPFIRVFDGLVTQGRDLNPLLQDPGFLFHPPMLYMGYVGFSVAFAFALSTLWAGEFDRSVVKWTRPWVLVAWCCLTLGITLGSWWAYRELGWGGFWFWDPVENASFMPWLVGTALIHSLLVAQKQQGLVVWVLLLSILAFALSLVGTFLVRSGVLTSVHAFAVDPTRGMAILIMLCLTIGGSLLLFAYRAKTIKATTSIPLVSKEMTLLLNTVFLVVAMLTVLLGTLYPLMIDALGLGKLSVGAPYFNQVFVPLVLPLFCLMGVGIQIPWGGQSTALIGKATKTVVCLLSFLFVIGMGVFRHQVLMVAGVVLALWILFTTVQFLWQKIKQHRQSCSAWAMISAHVGVALSVLGVSVSTGLGKQVDALMTLHQSLSFAGYQINFDQLEDLTGPNYHGVRAKMIIRSGETTHVVYPEKRIYDAGEIPMTDAAVDVTPFRDIYVALGEPMRAETWSVRLYYKPLVRWIWVGGGLMCFGGVLAVVSLLSLSSISTRSRR